MKAWRAIVVALFVAHALWLQCVAEDAYITFRFARNVAEGHGFVWNPGSPPVEGFTNFLWVAISATAHRLGLDLPHTAQALGLASAIVTLLICWHFARAALGVSEGVALLTMVMLAAAGPLAGWATSGMETTFFTLWVTTAVYCADRFARTATAAAALGVAGALFGATLTRPEGFGVAAIVLGLLGVLSWRDERRVMARAALMGAALYLAAFAVYFAWRYRTFGYPLPNTFYAKTGGGLRQYWRGAVYVGYFTLHFVLPWLPWGFLAPWRAAEKWSLTRAAQPRRWSSWLARWPGGIIAAAVIAGYTGYVVLVGGDYMAMYRFMVPVLPLLYVLFGAGIQQALDGLSIASPRRAVLALMAVATAAGIFVQSTPLEGAIFAPTPRMHGTYRGVNVERHYVNRFHVIGRYIAGLAARQPDRTCSILTYDIGVVGYLTRCDIQDMLGIVDPVIAHQPAPATMGVGLPGHEKQDFVYSYGRHPTFVMYTVQLRPAPADWPRYPPELEARVRAEYQLQSAWLEDPFNHEAGYFTYLERKR